MESLKLSSKNNLMGSLCAFEHSILFFLLGAQNGAKIIKILRKNKGRILQN